MDTRMHALRVGAVLATLIAATTAEAGFFIPKGTTMGMMSLSPNEQNFELSYGFDRRLSGMLGLTRVREGDAAAWRNVALGQATYLVHRQSTDDGIFNAYVWAGPIAERVEGENKTRLGGQAGVWLDFETRLIYSRIKAHTFKTERWRRNEVVAQGMLAPYKAEYDQIASWGGVQLKRASGESLEVTPYLRFFQRNWWVDAGVSVDRKHRNDFFLNVMYLF